MKIYIHGNAIIGPCLVLEQIMAILFQYYILVLAY